jgi:SpoVK/Ycf46/Vps4 family AAA+-type ATPase
MPSNSIFDPNKGSKDEDIMEKLTKRISNNCTHEKWDTPETIYANKLWDTLNVNSKNISFEGFGIKLCHRCGKVEWPENLITPRGQLEMIARTFTQVLTQGEKVSINWGSKNKKSEKKTTDSKEEASYNVEIPRFTLKDVILPDKTRLEIDEALVKIRNHKLIYEQWGLNKVDPSGKGISLNFYGPPGTGKTRTAEALAGELGVPFICVSAGELESRYMGETPKNIMRAFQAATDIGALLFFDEAESLFGRRASDVTQGVDHEVNVSKSTLLKELEKFEGVLVMASNFQEIYDIAFRRRVQHHILFSMPDRNVLESLLKMHIVESIPLSEERDQIIAKLTERIDAIEPDEYRFSGADILNMVRLALPAAVSESKENPVVEFKHFESGIDRVLRSKMEVGTRKRKSVGFMKDTPNS